MPKDPKEPRYFNMQGNHDIRPGDDGAYVQGHISAVPPFPEPLRRGGVVSGGAVVTADGSYRYLGNIAASKLHSVLLTCAHCMVSWGGCAAESWCPECHAPKGYYEHDYDECYCADCKPELAAIAGRGKVGG